MAENENANENEQDQPKIIVDDDWKAQAKAEKEKLAEQVNGGESAPAEGETPQLPPADFNTLIGSLTTQIFMSLGGIEDPRTKRRIVDLDLAKHHIDTLAMLEQKTAGNLSDDEKKLLDEALYETRMQYVQIAQNVSVSRPAPRTEPSQG